MVEVTIDRDACENNQFCFEVCPEEVFEIRNQLVVVVRPENCTSCWLCVQNCPTGAVSIE